MNWIKQNIGSIGLWLITISFAVYYILAYYFQTNGIERPVYVNNIELYGSIVGVLFISLNYAFKCDKKIERVMVAYAFVAFWGMLLLTYTLDEFFDSVIFTHKIITVTLSCFIICPLFYFYFRKQ